MSGGATVGADERLRLFLALELPSDVVAELGRWGERHLSRGRRLDSLHVTLAFLGSRPAGELAATSDALREAAQGAGEIVFSSGRYRETRSVAMVVLRDETGEGERLAGRLFDALERLGVYERERRRWLPHVTVLRFRSPPRLDPPVPDLGAFRPSDAAVYMSALRPSGAQYEVLESVPLGG